MNPCDDIIADYHYYHHYYHQYQNLFVYQSASYSHITIIIISMLKLSPDKQESCSGPIERVACLDLACTRSPTCSHWFQGWGWYSSTWQAKEKQSWSLIAIVKVHLLLIYNFITISIDWKCAQSSLFNQNLRSVGTSIPTPIHPEPASHNRSFSICQCSW